MTMKADQYTHDLHGNEVDGWYWQLIEEQFRSDRLVMVMPAAMLWRSSTASSKPQTMFWPR